MDSKMNHVCYCGIRSKLTTCWIYENSVTEMSKGFIVGLLKKVIATEQERKNERIVGFLLLGVVLLVLVLVLVLELDLDLDLDLEISDYHNCLE
ncbi:hypothetical protein GQ457_02G031700 [Hibiscus cannabinus]